MGRDRWARARQLLAGALAVTAVGIVGGPGTRVGADTATPELPHPNSHGITLLDTRPVDPEAGPDQSHMVDYTMSTDEIFEPRGPNGHDLNVPVGVRVWLPPGYDQNRAKPYPVLFLLHGGGGWYGQWTTSQFPPFVDARAVFDHGIDPDPTDATPGTAFPGIVVMPDGGWVGWYTNWAKGTQGGFAPNWETFHIDQLVPWVDANFNTSGRRSGRAIAGVSMGGIGTLMYATRHPLTFSAVGAFSAPADVRMPLLHKVVSENASGFPGAGASVGFTGLDNQDLWITSPGPDDVEGRFQAIFGPPGLGGLWLQRNPVPRAFTYHAFDGRFGLYTGQQTPTFPSEEADFGTANQAFHHALQAWGVNHRYCSGPGHHTAPFFLSDLADFLNYVYATPWKQCTTNPDWQKDWEPSP